MRSNVLFKDFKGHEHLRCFVGQSADRAIGKFDDGRGIETFIVLGVERPRKNKKTESALFLCELLVREGTWARPIIVKKTGKDFHRVVGESMLAAEKVLRRRSKKRSTYRRRMKAASMRVRAVSARTKGGGRDESSS